MQSSQRVALSVAQEGLGRLEVLNLVCTSDVKDRCLQGLGLQEWASDPLITLTYPHSAGLSIQRGSHRLQTWGLHSPGK